MTAVSLAAVLEVEDQDHKLIVVDLVEDPPGTRPHPPRVRIAHELGGLPRPRILRKPVDSALYLRLDGLVEAQECPASLVAEYDLVGHRVRIRPRRITGSQVCFGLDLLPWDERLARVDARARLARCCGVGEVFEQLGQLIRLQPLQLGRDRGGHDGGQAGAMFGDVHHLPTGSFMCRCRDGRGVLNG